MNTKQSCSVRVYPNDRWGAFHPHQCTKSAIVEQDGKWYCKVHDPEYIKQKQSKATAEYNTKANEWTGGKIAWAQCKKINPDNPIAVAESISDMYKALRGISGWLVTSRKSNMPNMDNAISAVRQVLAKADER